VIDKGLPEAWPQEVVEAAKRFQQGDLLTDPPIAYSASLLFPIWVLTRQESAALTEQDAEPAHLALHKDDGPTYGIVTSQTCDVAEDRLVPVQPWIDVSPVYLCEEGDSLLSRKYVFCLNAMDAPDGKCWVADLRLSVPLEKGLLVDREPIDPFNGSESERIAFGILLGERLARAALSESVHEVVEQTLNGHKRKTGKRVGTRVYKLLLQISQGTRLEPRVVRLHVVSRDSSAAKIDENEMQEWFQSWWDEAREVAEQHSVKLLAPAFHDGASMDVALYDGLVEIRCPLH
jgi:hypothetical protein